MVNDDDRPEGLNTMIRSTRDIKASLLRRAWEEGRSISSLIQDIKERTTRAREMPPEHQEILDELIPGQHPAVMRLNAQARMAGLSTRFHETAMQKSRPVAANYMDPHPTHQ